MQNSNESHSPTATEAEASATEADVSATEADISAQQAQRSSRRRLKLVLVTFGVIVTAFAVLFMMTENIGIAPFVYAIL